MKFAPNVVSALPLLLVVLVLVLVSSPWTFAAAANTNNVKLRSSNNNGNPPDRQHQRRHRSLLDAIAPVLTCKQMVKLGLPTATAVAVTTADVILTASDNSGSFTPTLNGSDGPYGCSFIGKTDDVEVVITDSSGNSASCKATVSVADTGNPAAKCVTKTVTLDATGAAAITPTEIGSGSTDNCDTSLTLTLSKMAFGCVNVGANTVTLTAADDAIPSNTGTCTAAVTVVDGTPPTFTKCANDVSAPVPVLLDPVTNTVNFAVNPTAVAATDACGTVTYAPATKSYACADVGARELDVVATDPNNNAATCKVRVKVFEDVKPTALCKPGPINLELKSSSAELTTAMVDNGSSDNCPGPKLSLSKDSFTCADLGSQTVTLTVTDTSGNTATCTITVNVSDKGTPDVDCVDVTIPVGPTGSVTIIPKQLLSNGDDADDNCGVPQSVVASPNSFTCANVGQPATTVTVLAKDSALNQDSCTSKVTIVDTTKPTTTACLPQTVQLDSTGTGSLNPALFTATDNCSSGSALAKTISKQSFTCADVGSKVITVDFTDASLNKQSCSPTINVVDQIKPVITTCPTTISIAVAGQGGTFPVPVTSVIATDNCVAVTKSATPILFDCANSSPTRSGVVVTVKDTAGNTATCTTTVQFTGNTNLSCGGGGFFEAIFGLLTCGIL